MGGEVASASNAQIKSEKGREGKSRRECGWREEGGVCRGGGEPNG